MNNNTNKWIKLPNPKGIKDGDYEGKFVYNDGSETIELIALVRYYSDLHGFTVPPLNLTEKERENVKNGTLEYYRPLPEK